MQDVNLQKNQRYAVVGQDLTTQWKQSYSCKTKTSEETQKSLRKFGESTRKPKVIYTSNYLEFDKVCEDFSCNHCPSTSHRSDTNDITEREDRSQEEIERQERYDRGDAWRLTKNVSKLKKTEKEVFNKTGVRKNCCRFRSAHTHLEQQRF